jgi:hypothetical protein
MMSQEREQNTPEMRIEELIAKGYLLLTPQGSSMWPMIRYGRDSVQVAPKTQRLQRFDVPVYRRKSGQVVFHRILKAVEGGYLICGDNQSVKEFVREEQILGVMTAYYRGEKRIELTARRYRFYVHTYCAMPLLLRRIFLFFAHLPRRVGRAFKRLFSKK